LEATISNIDLHSKIREINLEYDKVVIGSTLEALAYACIENVPIIFTSLGSPRRIDFFDHEEDLSIFRITNTPRTIQTNFSEQRVGIDKLYLWERLFFYLSVAGLCPLGDKAVSLRITNNIIKAPTATARMAKIHFNNLVVFDDTDVYGLGVPTIKDEKYKVYDWFDVRSGMKHKYDRIEDSTDFVNHILYYSSDRIHGEHNFKDAVSVSYLTEEQLSSFEYSDINARFKTLYMMKNEGIRGARNGRDVNDKTKYKYYAIKLQNTEREIVKPQNVYESFENVVFNYDSFNNIIKQKQLQECYVSRIIIRASQY
tara:strand:+ start:481 stop:1419 length:939 start_codon:yes stop_codon:yes gene_type:complete